MSNETKKMCGECLEYKALSVFHRHARSPDGRQTYCKCCSAARARAYKERTGRAHKAEKYQKRRRSYDLIRTEYAAKGCGRCGESHPACLEFHHRDPEAKEFEIGNWLSRRKLKEADLRAELEKCDPLCANCHRKLHWDEKGG